LDNKIFILVLAIIGFYIFIIFNRKSKIMSGITNKDIEEAGKIKVA